MYAQHLKAMELAGIDDWILRFLAIHARETAWYKKRLSQGVNIPWQKFCHDGIEKHIEIINKMLDELADTGTLSLPQWEYAYISYYTEFDEWGEE